MKSRSCAGAIPERRLRKRWRAGWPLGVIALGAAMVGCQSTPSQSSILEQHYRPNNVFAYPPKLALNLERVAVLPIAAENDQHDLPEGCAALTPVLLEQLVKTKRFEVVAVDPERLREGTGQPHWTGGETLPAGFLDFLRREYGCDGVLFAELTAYRPYAPLAVGWRLKLVDARSGQILWAADEFFDATRKSVTRGAEQFGNSGFALPFAHEGNWLALNSPNEFGRYSAATLLNSLPDR